MATFNNFDMLSRSADASINVLIGKALANPLFAGADGIGYGPGVIRHLEVDFDMNPTAGADGYVKAIIHPNAALRNGRPYVSIWNGTAWVHSMISGNIIWDMMEYQGLLSAGIGLKTNTSDINRSGTLSAVTWNTVGDGLGLTDSAMTLVASLPNKLINATPPAGTMVVARCIGDAVTGSLAPTRGVANTKKLLMNLTAPDITASGMAIGATTWQNVLTVNRSGLVTTTGALGGAAFVPVWSVTDPVNFNFCNTIARGTKILGLKLNGTSYCATSAGGSMSVYTARLAVTDSAGAVHYSNVRGMPGAMTSNNPFAITFNDMAIAEGLDIISVSVQIAVTVVDGVVNLTWYNLAVDITQESEVQDLAQGRALYVGGKAPITGSSYAGKLAMNVVVIPTEDYLIANPESRTRSTNPAKLREWLMYLDAVLPGVGYESSFEANAAALDNPSIQALSTSITDNTPVKAGGWFSKAKDWAKNTATNIYNNFMAAKNTPVAQSMLQGALPFMSPQAAAAISMANDMTPPKQDAPLGNSDSRQTMAK